VAGEANRLNDGRLPLGIIADQAAAGCKRAGQRGGSE
jgi:hypothetical protein